MWNEKMYRRIWCSIYKPLKDCIGEGPQRLECTNCKEVAYFAFDVEKDNLQVLPRQQVGQMEGWTLLILGILHLQRTTFTIIFEGWTSRLWCNSYKEEEKWAKALELQAIGLDILESEVANAFTWESSRNRRTRLPLFEEI